jgi:ankyrin repeat protein
MNRNNKNIKKCLKSYLIAKKYLDTDIDKSYEYFKQCITLLNNFKEKKIDIEGFKEIMEETETECNKYLTYTIEITLDKPLNIKNDIKLDNNELFQIIETGDLSKLKSYNYGEVSFSDYNNEGLTVLHYAIKFGDTSFIKQAFKLGAAIDQTNKFGHTLLEYACLEKDPNMINFLINYGANMKKHLIFREGKKYFNNGKQIDIILLEKTIMEYNNTSNNIKHLDWIFKYINKDDLIELELSNINNSTISETKITNQELIIKLDNLINSFDNDSRNTYLSIIKEELNYNLAVKLGCPTNKIEIILYNLVPFINYDNNLNLNWLISLEIKCLILKILKNKTKINTTLLKNELMELLYLSYIKPGIIQEGLIQIIVLQWIYKIKV